MFLAVALIFLACHYAQEAVCGHGCQHARWSCAAAAAAYAVYAAMLSLIGH